MVAGVEELPTQETGVASFDYEGAEASGTGSVVEASGTEEHNSLIPNLNMAGAIKEGIDG